jgi:hypothetical protein
MISRAVTHRTCGTLRLDHPPKKDTPCRLYGTANHWLDFRNIGGPAENTCTAEIVLNTPTSAEPKIPAGVDASEG